MSDQLATVDPVGAELRFCLRCNRWAARAAIAYFFCVVSRMGDGICWVALILGILVFGGAQGPHVALQMSLTGAAAALLYRSLKHCTRRARPYRSHTAIVPRIPALDEFSFPSGHTLHAVTFSAIALMHFLVLAPLLVPFVVLVAASRVVLGLHYPSDVLAAGVIGVALATSSEKLSLLLQVTGS